MHSLVKIVVILSCLVISCTTQYSDYCKVEHISHDRCRVICERESAEISNIITHQQLKTYTYFTECNSETN